MDRRQHLGHGGFDRKWMVDILRGIAFHAVLPPVQIVERPQNGYRYQLGNGTHRFYASIVARFLPRSDFSRLDSRYGGPCRSMTSARKKATLNLIDKHVGGRLRMRRMMLDMSQEKLADAFGITFQQVQKYEKGTNRISAGRLQHAANLLQVPVQFFFQGAPVGSGTQPDGSARSPAYVSEFVSSSDGLRLIKAFTRIESGVRRRIVDLVQEIAAADGE
jgi:transcriptional regulator with XRE-family HTH domain